MHDILEGVVPIVPLYLVLTLSMTA